MFAFLLAVLCEVSFLSPETFLKSVFSAQFILELTHLSICQLRLWYFIGSLDWQIALQSSDSKESGRPYCYGFYGFYRKCKVYGKNKLLETS